MRVKGAGWILRQARRGARSPSCFIEAEIRVRRSPPPARPCRSTRMIGVITFGSRSSAGAKSGCAPRIVYLALCPGLALAHWFAATVFVARQVFDAALDQLRAGCASQDAQRKESGRFNAVGLHLLHGLVLAAQGDTDGAIEEFGREMAFEADGQLYARECSAEYLVRPRSDPASPGSTRRSAGGISRRRSKRVPGHPLAAIGVGAMSPLSGAHPPAPGPHNVDAAIVKAAALTLEGKHREAALLCGEALTHAEPGPAGWLLPLDPLLHATDHHHEWAQTLATLRDRSV